MHTKCGQNYVIKLISFGQVVEKKLPDICGQLRVNLCFLSFFVSAAVMEIRHVDQIMQVNREIT